MNKEIHWDLLNRRLLILLLCSSISVWLVFYSVGRFDEVNSDYQNDQKKLAQYERDYKKIIEEEKLYKKYSDRFKEYDKKGYIGEEQQILWIEVIQDINRTLKLPVLKYDIAARQPLQLSNFGIASNSEIALYESTMSLNIGLLHAGDLYVFFSELEKRAKGLFEIRGCDLTRVSVLQYIDIKRVNVNASCLLSWYTIDVGDELKKQ